MSLGWWDSKHDLWEWGYKDRSVLYPPPTHTFCRLVPRLYSDCSFVGSLYLFITQTKCQTLQENNIPRHWSPSLWDLTASTEAGRTTLSFGWERALVHQGVCSMLRIKGRRDNEVEQKTELEGRGLCCVWGVDVVAGGRCRTGEGWFYRILGHSLPPSPAIASEPPSGLSSPVWPRSLEAGIPICRAI